MFVCECEKCDRIHCFESQAQSNLPLGYLGTVWVEVRERAALTCTSTRVPRADGRARDAAVEKMPPRVRLAVTPGGCRGTAQKKHAPSVQSIYM